MFRSSSSLAGAPQPGLSSKKLRGEEREPMGRETPSKAAAATACPLPDTRARTEASLHLQYLQQPHPALQFYKVITLATDSQDLSRSTEPEQRTVCGEVEGIT